MRLPVSISLHRQRRQHPRVSLLAVEAYDEAAGDPFSSIGVRPPGSAEVHHLRRGAPPAPPARPLAEAS